MPASADAQPPPCAAVQAHFVAMLGRIRHGIRRYIRFARPGSVGEDLRDEAIALAWRAVLTHERCGHNWRDWPELIGRRAAVHALRGCRVGSPRRTSGQSIYPHTNDRNPCFPRRARNDRRHATVQLDDIIPLDGPNPAAAAALRVDWTAFLATLPPLERCMVDRVPAAGTACHAGQEIGLSRSGAHGVMRRVLAAWRAWRAR